MGVFATLGEKPWLSPSEQAATERPGPKSVPMPMMGLRFFLLVVGLMFMLLTSVYFMRMEFPDWRAVPEPWLLWINTGLLVLASIAFQAARNAVRRGDLAATRTGLMVAGGFSLAFLIGQLLAWRILTQLGYFADSNPANAFFYLITALHWVHLAGGVVAWVRTMARARNAQANGEKLRLGVGLCTVYWHFLLLVWVVMFALLLAT